MIVIIKKSWCLVLAAELSGHNLGHNVQSKRKTPTVESCGGLGFGFYDLIEPMIVPAIIIIDDIRANRLDTILSPIKTSRLMFMARVKTPTTTKRMPKIFQWLMIYPL